MREQDPRATEVALAPIAAAGIVRGTTKIVRRRRR